MNKTTFKDYNMSVKAVFDNRIVLNNQSLIDNIHTISLPNTPFRTGDLRNTVKKTSSGYNAWITWDVDYAAYQERGANPDGSRPVRHYTTAGTGPWFARRAVEEGVRKLGEHWNKSSQSIPQNRLY